MIVMTIGERLKALVTDSDKKQYAIAEELGVVPSTFSNYVTDVSILPGDVAARAAVFFGVSTDYLLCLTDIKEPAFAVSTQEREILLAYRTLSKEQKELILQNVKLMHAQNQR